MDGNAETPKIASEKPDLKENKVLADPFIGVTLNERYLINELIGVGGWGNVYRATHLTLENEVAVKIVHRHHLQHEDNIKRFKREARALHKIESDAVVKVIDADVEPAPFLVMEHFDGEPLSKWLERHGPMNAYLAMDLFIQLCNGLTAAAALKIVHRDLKPANILIKVSGKTVQAKMLDFGLAKFMDHQSTGGAKNITATGDILGSPPYMSPEQWKGQADSRSDIYSLGCIMYEVLAGKPAFSAQYGLDYLHKHLSEKPKPIEEIYPQADLPPGLEEIVSACMAKSVERRYQTSDMCKRDLILVMNGAMPQNYPSTIYSAKLDKTKLIPLVAIVAVLLLAFVVLPMMRGSATTGVGGTQPQTSGANATSAITSTSTNEQLVASSFPQAWIGYWGGSLTVKSVYDWQNKAPRPAYAPGQSGVAVFNFVKGSDFVYHKPPTIFFKGETRSLGEVANAPDSLLQRQAQARAAGFASLDPNQKLNSIPTLKMGNVSWRMLDGSTHSETVKAIKVLKSSADLYQEDINKDVEHIATNAPPAKYSSLIISRIKQASPDSLSVHIEKITCGADRVVRTRQVMEGTLTRGWQNYANTISQETHRPWNKIIVEFDI